MYQLPKRLTIPMTATWNPAAWRGALPTLRLRRLMATSAFALISLAALQPPAQAQTLNEEQFCYAIADNNPAGQGSGGRLEQDTLSRIDNFAARQATAIAPVTRLNGGSIGDIEALTSRPDFGELIAANANEIGSIDPATGVFRSLGSIAGVQDFDAIVIDRNSPRQTRLIGISKSLSTPNPDNRVIEIEIQLDSEGLASGVTQTNVGSEPEIDLSGLPSDVFGIDGIAISPSGIVYGVANGGPLTSQRLVTINLGSGATRDLGAFTLADGTIIEDVEDLSFDLTNNILFATSGSNFGQSGLTNNAFIFTDPQGAVGDIAAVDNFDLSVPTGAIDYEASACIRFPEDTLTGSLLLVKRITAVTRNGEETRFDDFTDQAGEEEDNRMQEETNQTFPVGLVEAPTPLAAGDLVEYTVYLYNPTNRQFQNVVLCDPLQLPSILQRDSIEFSIPRDNLALSFASRGGFARRPLAAADDACLDSLNGEEQFRGSDPNGPGGGVVTNSFNIGPEQVSATRFVIEVGGTQPETNTNTDPETNTNTDPETNTNTDPETDTDPEAS